MPENTLQATYDHGVIPSDSVRGYYEQARDVLDRLESLGIHYDDVVDLLEREGVEKFEQSWTELTDAVAAELRRLGRNDA
jgi:transaldolase